MIVKNLKIFIFAFIVFSANITYGFGVFNIPYNKSDKTLNKLAMRFYNSNTPYIYTYGAYIYNALLLRTTMPGCKVISIIRCAQGFPKPAYWAIENYKICGCNIK